MNRTSSGEVSGLRDVKTDCITRLALLTGLPLSFPRAPPASQQARASPWTERPTQTPKPVFTTESIPAAKHQLYDEINESIETNKIDPVLFYPEGHRPELVREWPLTEDIEIPNPFATPKEKEEEPN